MAVSDQTRSQAIERWGLDRELVATISPGIRGPEQPVIPEAITMVRRRHSLPERYFLSVGALEPRKAPDVLVRAFARARAGGLDAELAIVGEGRLEPELRGEGVHLLGRLTDGELDHLYVGALALVMPSRLEGFGLPPLEAAARGTPSVVSDLPTFSATLPDAALRVPIDDELALARALTDIAGDARLRDRLAARAREAARRFSLERSARDAYAVIAAAAGLGRVT